MDRVAKAVALAALCGAAAVQAQQPAAGPSTGIAALAAGQGVKACLGPLQAVEAALLGGREYSFRAFVDPRDPNAGPFTAIVDARKVGTLDRVLINLVATPVGTPATRCVLMYEQTRYHDQRCEAVLAQMAPKATASLPSFGAVTVDVEKNLTVTLIPVGSGQCVTVVKEVAY